MMKLGGYAVGISDELTGSCLNGKKTYAYSVPGCGSPGGLRVDRGAMVTGEQATNIIENI
jgi:hypothetical protein